MGELKKEHSLIKINVKIYFKVNMLPWHVNEEIQ